MAKQKIDPQNIDKLVEYVGGRDNIATVTHCITRLRFVLNDESKINAKAIEELPMVKANFSTGGQYQVVIGQEVGDYYKLLLENWLGKRRQRASKSRCTSKPKMV